MFVLIANVSLEVVITMNLNFLCFLTYCSTEHLIKVAAWASLENLTTGNRIFSNDDKTNSKRPTCRPLNRKLYMQSLSAHQHREEKAKPETHLMLCMLIYQARVYDHKQTLLGCLHHAKFWQGVSHLWLDLRWPHLRLSWLQIFFLVQMRAATAFALKPLKPHFFRSLTFNVRSRIRVHTGNTHPASHNCAPLFHSFHGVYMTDYKPVLEPLRGCGLTFNLMKTALWTPS